MLEKNKVFFGEKGLTSTSANHLANMAKEVVLKEERALENVSFVSRFVELLQGGHRKQLLYGWTVKEMEHIPTMLSTIGNMKAFQAWVREAIKARDEEKELIEGLSLQNYCEVHNLRFPTYPDYKPFTEDMALAELNIKERNEYYRIEAHAAQIGKYIHPNGKFSQAREVYMKKMLNKAEASGTGINTVCYEYEGSITYQEMDEMFFKLQDQHRELNARLNQIKHKLKTRVEDETLKRSGEYQRALATYQAEIKDLNLKLQDWKAGLLKELGNLKIIIPAELEETFNHLNGKKA